MSPALGARGRPQRLRARRSPPRWSTAAATRRAPPSAASAPDLAAGHALAAALGTPGLPVTPRLAPRAAPTLAQRAVGADRRRSSSRCCSASDNVIAECLARQVAVAEHQPASFAGAAAAVRAACCAGSASTSAPACVDGSGLAASDRLTPAALAGVLRLVAGAAGPGAARRRSPACRSRAGAGTLADRYLDAAVDGRRRAWCAPRPARSPSCRRWPASCTTRDGRLLAFAFIADRVGPYRRPTRPPPRPRSTRSPRGWPPAAAPDAPRPSLRASRCGTVRHDALDERDELAHRLGRRGPRRPSG